MDESLALARAAVADGTGTIVATPHLRFDFVTEVGQIAYTMRELRAAMAEVGIPLTVRMGAEIGHEMVGRLGQHDLQAVAQGPPGARWLLLEAPFEGLAEDFHLAAEELRERGFGVVIAHPERSADAIEDGAVGLRRELDRGAVAQFNALSLAGMHGEEAEDAAYGLLHELGLLCVVASDAHGPTRPPALGLARASLLSREVDVATTCDLTVGGPRRLLARGLPHAAPMAA
jgi:protein-tyrosine phosphatase